MGSSTSHETLYSVNKDKDGYKYYAKFENDYFAEGACRWAFKGTLHGSGPRDNKTCVTKVFKKEYAKTYLDWAPDIAASKKAKEFVDLFKTKYSTVCGQPVKDIEFVIPLIAKMQHISTWELLWFIPVSTDDRYAKINEYVAIEPFISGNYEKFNSNGGYEDRHRAHDALLAFTHWTWHKSGHKYMICDLQGVWTSSKIILTDPAIHSYDRQFGPTDLGIHGMEMVLSRHQCNDICRSFGLSNPVQGIHIPNSSGKKSSTYSFQVTEQQLMKQKSHYFDMLPVIAE